MILLLVLFEFLDVDVRIDNIRSNGPFVVELRLFGQFKNELGVIVLSSVVIGQKEVESRISHFHLILLEVRQEGFFSKINPLRGFVNMEAELPLLLLEGPRYDTARYNLKIERFLAYGVRCIITHLILGSWRIIRIGLAVFNDVLL